MGYRQPSWSTGFLLMYRSTSLLFQILFSLCATYSRPHSQYLTQSWYIICTWHIFVEWKKGKCAAHQPFSSQSHSLPFPCCTLFVKGAAFCWLCLASGQITSMHVDLMNVFPHTCGGHHCLFS